MFKDNEILDALHRLSKQVEQIQDELRNEIVKRELDKGTKPDLIPYAHLKKPAWPPVPKNLGIWPQPGYVGLSAHVNTGTKAAAQAEWDKTVSEVRNQFAMTPQQAAGVPDELPEWMIPLYQHFIGLQGVDLADLLNKAAAGRPDAGIEKSMQSINMMFAIPADVLKSGPAGNSSTQAPRRQCGCPVALPVHLTGCSQTSKNWQQRVGHCKCSPGPNENCPLHGIYVTELQVLIKREVAQVYEEMKNCKDCASTFCKSHAYGSVARIASDRVKNSPRGKELALILDTIGKPDCICPKDRPDLIAPDCPQHRGAK